MRTAPQSTDQWPTLVATASTQEISAGLGDRHAHCRTGCKPRPDDSTPCESHCGGADINKRDNICLNPFLWGCISGNLDVVRMGDSN